MFPHEMTARQMARTNKELRFRISTSPFLLLTARRELANNGHGERSEYNRSYKCPDYCGQTYSNTDIPTFPLNSGKNRPPNAEGYRSQTRQQVKREI